jgi:pyruvate/2-oxoglutarate/acetoin dehydrogenase E1 component
MTYLTGFVILYWVDVEERSFHRHFVNVPFAGINGLHVAMPTRPAASKLLQEVAIEHLLN